MKPYEKDLAKLIQLSNRGCELVHQDSAGLDEADLRFLSAKGFIALLPAGDGAFWVRVEPPGLTHVADKKERREGFIKEHIASFLSGFASGVLVTLAGVWIARLL